MAESMLALSSPDDVTLQSSRIDFATIHAIQRQHIRRVQVLAPALCHVVHGHKVVHWQGQRFEITPDHLLVFPAGATVDIENYPSQGVYQADIVSFPLPFILDYQLRHQSALGTNPAQRADQAGHAKCPACLSVPRDAAVSLSWSTLLSSIRQDLPLALQQHHAEGLLLALQGTAQLELLLTVNRHQLRHRLQQLFLQQCDYNWQLSDAARHLYLGESTLRRKLAEEQTSFKRVLDEVRFAVALGMVQTTQLPIGSIAERCGYQSASRFAVKFRQIYGLAPSELRVR